MATSEEIERRVDEADAARKARRSAAAQRVGALAARRAAIAEQLSDIEAELGDVLAESSDVIDIGELATFTDVPAADLTRCLNDRKTNRTKRRKPTASGAVDKKTTRTEKPAGPQELTNQKTPAPRENLLASHGAARTPAGVTR